ncbi:MAG: nucleotide exchange factor GrpE, partial [Patescibacteria group bacterium]
VNARRRDEEAKQEFLKFSKQNIIEEILPVLDSFDLAMGNKESWESVSSEWRTGVENIYNQFLGILSKHGVTPFGAIGDAFDPNLHQSISTVPTEDKSNDHKLAE